MKQKIIEVLFFRICIKFTQEIFVFDPVTKLRQFASCIGMIPDEVAMLIIAYDNIMYNYRRMYRMGNGDLIKLCGKFGFDTKQIQTITQANPSYIRRLYKEPYEGTVILLLGEDELRVVKKFMVLLSEFNEVFQICTAYQKLLQD